MLWLGVSLLTAIKLEIIQARKKGSGRVQTAQTKPQTRQFNE